MSDAPRYIHNCEQCTYLGQYEEYDLYHCMQGSMALPTVLARYGPVGSEYLSGLPSSQDIPALAEARQRAVARSLSMPQKVRYSGTCDQCGTETEGPEPGPWYCKWGRCNGSVTLHRPRVINWPLPEEG